MTTTKTETMGGQVVLGISVSPEAAVCDAIDTEPLPPLPIDWEHLHCTKHGSAQLDCWYECHDPECIMTDRADLTPEFMLRLTIHSHPLPTRPYQYHYHAWWLG